MVYTLGGDLLARDRDGKLLVRIATVFPAAGVLVTVPGIHATQRVAYVDMVDARRARQGQPPLTDDEQMDAWTLAVDLVLQEDGIVLIRPDPTQMDLAFEADDLLQQIVSKKQIRFLYVMQAQVHEAIKRRGECWRISPLPRSPEEMAAMIMGSRIAIGGRQIYYYNSASGTRFLTYEDFAALGALPEAELREHLAEISEYVRRKNRMYHPEIALFMCSDRELPGALGSLSVGGMDADVIHETHDALRHQFQAAVAPPFRRDDPENAQWRNAMYATLIHQSDTAVCEEELLGLSPEFFLQVDWLPGGRIEEGELVLDTMFDDEDPETVCMMEPGICDVRARTLILNFLRDFGDLEYINIGRIAGSLSHHQAYTSHRGVYLAEFKEHDRAEVTVRILRMQKRGVWERLEEGHDMLTAIVESDQYTEQILDRRLACRQLGMNLPPRVMARKLAERYTGCNEKYAGQTIWSTYFERDYVRGLATDKISATRLADAVFAERLARLLGRAAAPNLIVGRVDPLGTTVYDSGDELLVEDADGYPVDVVVTDQTGTFLGWKTPLMELLPPYAKAVIKRAPWVPDANAFAERYVQSFRERFEQIQRDFRKRRRGFDSLLRYARKDGDDSLPIRWRTVLERLDDAEPGALAEALRSAIGPLDR